MLRFALSLFAAQASAHFLLNFPPTIGFDDASESQAPCGSFQVDFSKDNVTDFHVGGDVIAVTSIHPQATWLFRATLDHSVSGNFTNLLPAVQQTGLGAYCEPDITIPSSWAGKQGVIQVVQDAPDGLLFQCAAVNFVSGTVASIPSVCHNVTGLSATYTADAALSTLPASATASATGGSTSPTSTTNSSAGASASSKASSDAVQSFSNHGIWSLLGCGGIAAAVLLETL